LGEIFSWSNGVECGWASRMMDTPTVKDKGPRALFFGRSPGTGAPLQPLNNNKIIRSQARKLACSHYKKKPRGRKLASSHYKKTSRSQARTLKTDRKKLLYYLAFYARI